MFLPDTDLKRRREAPVYSLDRQDQLINRQKKGFSRMEWRVIVFLPVLLVVLAWFAWDLRNSIAASAAAGLRPIQEDIELPAMLRPDYDVLPPMPAEAEIAGQRAAATKLVAEGKPLPLTVSAYDAMGVAWAEARLDADRAAPPFPSRLGARDLVLPDHIRLGTPLIVEGLLEDRLEAPVAGSDRPWQRLLLALDEKQYVEVLSDARPAAELAIGLRVRVTGRLLTYGELKAGTATVTLPVLLGRVVVEAKAQRDENDALAEYHRPWSLPEGIYGEVDDFRLWTETRPYYYTLGHVLRDQTTAGVYDEAVDGNQAADDVHLNPAAYRGKPFRITGQVYQAWEDKEVASDLPFGVGRVARVLLWNRDFAPFTETKDGKSVRTIKLVLRLYELAAVTNQPLPEPGQKITATGRFLKKRAIPVKPDVQRDRANQITRQSDRVYTWMYVTGPWQPVVEPPPDHSGPFAWMLVAIGAFGLVVGIVWWRREVRFASERAKTKVAELRAKRLQATTKAEPAPSPPVEAGQAPPPP